MYYGVQAGISSPHPHRIFSVIWNAGVHSVRNVHRGRATRSVGQPASAERGPRTELVERRRARTVRRRALVLSDDPHPLPPECDAPGARTESATAQMQTRAPALRPQATARGACAHGARVHRTGRSKRNEGLLISQYIDNNTVSERTRSRTDGIRAVRVPSESFSLNQVTARHRAERRAM